MNNVSDFSIPASIARVACKAAKTSFIDLPILFEYIDGDKVGLLNGKLYIGSQKSLFGTLWGISFAYLNDFQKITSVELFEDDRVRMDALVATYNFYYTIFHDPSYISSAKPEAFISQRLYQYPLVWIILRDVICPCYDIELKNLKVVAGCSPYLNVAQAFKKKDVEGKPEFNDSEIPFVFSNAEVVYKPCLMASLLVSSISALGLDVRIILRELLESELRDKFVGLAKLAFKDDKKVNDFMLFLVTEADIINKIDVIINDNKPGVPSRTGKFAQQESMSGAANGISNSFWYLGLIEKMLDNSRGSDWDTYFSLEPYRNELFDKINEARKDKGLDGLSYEALLRIKSKENTKEDIKILENLIAPNRVW